MNETRHRIQPDAPPVPVTPDPRPATGRGRNLLSGIAGGLVVAVLGFGAISSGLVGKTETINRAITNGVPTAISGDEGLVHEIYKRDGNGVGFITATGVSSGSSPFDPFGDSRSGQATGSGFLIDRDGHMVTNNHVIDGAAKITVKLGEDETSYSAKVVGTDPSTDLALLKVDAPSDVQQPLALGDSGKVRVGDVVVAIGNPFGLDRTVTTGIVSALQREIQSTNQYSISNVIQTDAAINPGNSGGPLINSAGEVIGVNSQIATDGSSQGNVGIGFAVPSNTVKDVVEQIKSTGKVKHAFLGMTATTVTPALAEALNLGVEKGAMIQSLAKGGPGAKAGLKAGSTAVTVDGQEVATGGDIITAVDGTEVTSMEQVVSAVNAAAVGDKLKLTVNRDGKSREVTVTLGERPDTDSEKSSDQSGGEDSPGGGMQLPPGFGE